jgi:cbb3-type cytochrome oxidase maturation protein
MEVVFILLPLALIVAGLMLTLFVWAVRDGQFDDLETPPLRLLVADEPVALCEKPPAPDAPSASDAKETMRR